MPDRDDILALIQDVIDDQISFLGEKGALAEARRLPLQIDADGTVTEFYGTKEDILEAVMGQYRDLVGPNIASKRIRELDNYEEFSEEVDDLLDGLEDTGLHHLQTEDLLIPGGGVFIVYFLIFIAARASVEVSSELLLIDIIPISFILITAYFSLKTVEIWHGEIQRYIEILLISYTLFGVVLYGLQFPYHNIGTPAILGLSATAINGFIRTLLIGLMVFMTFGFYLFHRAAGERSIALSDDQQEGLLHLSRQDFVILGTIVLSALVAAFIGQFLQMSEGGAVLSLYFIILPGIVGLYYVHRATVDWGGEMARYLEVIGLGLAMQMLVFIPFEYWHITGSGAIAGLSDGAVYVLLHGLRSTAFLTVAYGFYLFAQTRE